MGDDVHVKAFLISVVDGGEGLPSCWGRFNFKGNGPRYHTVMM